MPHFILHLINNASGSAVLMLLAIIAGTLILEDATVVVVGILAADGIVAIPIALISLCIGILTGDFGFYFLGRLARTHHTLARYVNHNLIIPLRVWLEERFSFTIFAARFIPGSRLPTYAATGFFRLSFSRFSRIVFLATVLWVACLFTLSYWFGTFTTRWIGPLRWGIALAFLIALFFIGRRNFNTYRAKCAEARAKAEHLSPTT